MEKQLAQLISDYQAAVGAAIALMSKSGIETPSNINDWINLDIPANGELCNGIRYFKHGQGCTVHFPDGGVDFDFGRRGQIDGFDEWRLWRFCQNKGGKYPYDTQQTLSTSISLALQKGYLVAEAQGVFYVADSVALLGEDVAQILVTGCALPHWNRDSVEMLSAQCFDSADVMLKHYLAVDQLWTKKQRLSKSSRLKLRVYILSWLGYLHTTTDGFKRLKMRFLLKSKRPASFVELIAKCDALGKLAKRYSEDLRKLRNDTFHLSTDDEAIRKFFSDDGERLVWARELHAAFESFFSSYRVMAELHYLTVGRYGESRLRAESDVRRNKRNLQAKVNSSRPVA